MLHTQSRQGGAQGYRALIAAAAALIILTAACRSRAEAEAEAERQRMEQLYEENTPQAQSHLQELFAQAHDSIYANRMASRYYSADGEWRWMQSPSQLALCNALYDYLSSHVEAMGFRPDAFYLPSIAQGLAVMQRPDSVEGVAQVMAQLEADLTRAYLRYSVGQRFGFTTPKAIFGERQYDIEIEQADSAFVADAMQQLTDDATMLRFLGSVEPADSAYHRLEAQLPLDTTDEARRRTLANMERLRWRHRQATLAAPCHIFVNIAAQQLWAVGPDSVNVMRICCGKTSTKTPLLTSCISRIELNPEWGVPQSIIRGEMSHRAGDSAYFARNRYYITNSSGERVDPRNVSSDELRSGRYAIRQRSGAGNALGRIIFRFDNRFSVYLHDTSSPSAFGLDRRTVSHGCVRLQRPFEIARFVLPEADDWTLDKMRLSIDMQPQTDRGRDYRAEHAGEAIRLVKTMSVEPQVPLLIDYYTRYPNPKDGQLNTWPDIYGYDAPLLVALKPYLP